MKLKGALGLFLTLAACGGGEQGSGDLPQGDARPREVVDSGRPDATGNGDAISPPDARPAPDAVPETDTTPPPADAAPVDASPPDAVVEVDSGEVFACDGHAVIDLNAALVDGAVAGTTVGAATGLAASCGGGAGGEVVYAYTVDAPLDALLISTDNDATRAPTVLYVRGKCDDPMDLGCTRGSAANPGSSLRLDDVQPGLYFIMVDTGSRDGGGDFRLTVETVAASACRNGVDDDLDGRVDLADPGCEAPRDATEADPASPPECADGADNDADGRTDYPLDPECSAAGVDREAPLCDLPLEIITVDEGGGLFPVTLDPNTRSLLDGTCAFGSLAEAVFRIDIERPVRLTASVSSPQFGRGGPASLYLKSTCADRLDVACVGPFQGGGLDVRELNPGTYFLFVDLGREWLDFGFGGAFMGDLEITTRPLRPACSDELDNDADGRVDAADLGCRDAIDKNEADEPVLRPFCADGQDNDADGQIDFPADPGCAAAGDACEQPGWGLCGGECLDITTDAANCGECGNACAEGVACIDGACGGVFRFEGILEALPVNELTGWEECFRETYDVESPVSELLASCDGDSVLIGCMPTGADILQLAAMGDTEAVFFDTGVEAGAVSEHNGVAFYFNDGWSIGFAPLGSDVVRNSCDVGLGDDALRMCWHTGGGNTNYGYRCGESFPGGEYERVAFKASRAGNAMVALLCANGADDDGDGAIDAADAGCDGPYDNDEIDAAALVPACADGIDNDNDGSIDFPVDADCLAAGDATEVLRCGLDAPVVEVPFAGGQFGMQRGSGADTSAGTCGNGRGTATVFALDLVEPARIRATLTRNGTPIRGVFYARTACDDDATEIACAAPPRARDFTIADAPRGTLYVFVEASGAAGATVEFEIVSNLTECNDALDNDEDGLVDLLDPGCERGLSPSERDPQVAPVCADGLDNDRDGRVDYPADLECTGAGGRRETLLCVNGAPVIELGPAGGEYIVPMPVAGGVIDAQCDRRGFEDIVFAYDFPGPTTVGVTVVTDNRDQVFYGVWSRRTACDDPASEAFCQPAYGGRDGQYREARVEGQGVLVFEAVDAISELGIFADNLVFNVTLTEEWTACENRRDDDRDGLIDLFDIGCVGPRDASEADPPALPFCADGVDNDLDGVADYPSDDGCAGAGDACEQVGFGLCGGECVDIVSSATNCGACGIRCDAGVECIDGYCGGAVPIFPNDAFGHHGSCDAWNQCVDAQGCADAACRLEGYGRAVEFSEGSCENLPNQGIRCNLFFGLPDLDYQADFRGCELPVAYNIRCLPN